MAYYGVGVGWCFTCGGFAADVMVTSINAATLLDPVPPVTPVGMGKATRGVEPTSVEDIDGVRLAVWMRQITAVAGMGCARR